MIVTIDGPGGSGKSTMAKILAKRTGINYLDTGAMYRAVGYWAKKNNVDPDDPAAVRELIRDLVMNVWTESGIQQVEVNGENVTPYIRENSVSMVASTISKIPAVRLKMVDLQRKIASKGDYVLDGRDTGSFVFPNADYKFYITATSDVRAERRRKELAEKGTDITFEELKREIQARDEQDMNREFAPLVVPKDAIIIDTSAMTVDEVYYTIKRYLCK